MSIAVKRYKLILKDWIESEKRLQLEASLSEWLSSDESKRYWAERSRSNIPSTASATSTNRVLNRSASTSAFTVSSKIKENLALFYQENLTRPEESDSSIINKINYSWQFHSFQQLILNQINANTLLTLESDCHQLLALSSILLLTEKYPTDMNSCFTPNTLSSLRSKTLNDLGVGTYTFPGELSLSIIDFVKSVCAKRISKEAAGVSLLNLSLEEAHVTRKIHWWESIVKAGFP